MFKLRNRAEGEQSPVMFMEKKRKGKSYIYVRVYSGHDHRTSFPAPVLSCPDAAELSTAASTTVRSVPVQMTNYVVTPLTTVARTPLTHPCGANQCTPPGHTTQALTSDELRPNHLWRLVLCREVIRDGYVYTMAIVCELANIQLPHALVSSLCKLRRLRSGDTPVATSTRSAQILAFKSHSPWKATGLLGEMTDRQRHTR